MLIKNFIIVYVFLAYVLLSVLMLLLFAILGEYWHKFFECLMRRVV